MLSDSDIREHLGPIPDPNPGPNPNRRRSSGNRIATLVGLVIVLWIAGIALILHLESISPTAADPASGHVYWFSDSIHTVYLTAQERNTAWGAVAVPAGVTILLLLVGLLRKPPEPE
jgi:hypothetical protein